MKIRTASQHGLSLLEAVIVVATVFLFIAFIIPLLARSMGPRGRSTRIMCTSNLKQVGLAARIYANDHEDRFPWNVSTNFNPTNTSGSAEFTNSWQVFRHFQAMSNELVKPKILQCPSDDTRKRAVDFTNFGHANLSYFVGFDALETQPQTILSGDRNITGGTFLRSNLFLVTASNALSWTKAMHVSAGNIGLGDGSVQQVNIPSLNRQRAADTNPAVRFAIP